MSSRASSRGMITPILIVALLASLTHLMGSARAAPSGPAAADANAWVTDGPVYSSVLSANGATLYLGGQFKYLGPQTGSLASLSATNGSTQSFPKVNGEVKTIVPDGSGGWFIGGNFMSVVDVQGANQGVVQTRNRLAHILSNNTVDPNWTPLANGPVATLAVSGNILYVGGGFCYIGSTPAQRSHVAALSVATGATLSWNPSVGPAACGSDDSTVSALAIGGTTIYVGGTFSSIGGQARNNLAAVSAAGAVQGWNPSPDSSVYALLFNGATIYAGGAFLNVGTNPVVPNTILAAFDTGTGGLAAGWANPRISYSIGASSFIFVNTLALSGSTLYFGGIFDNVGVDAPQPHSPVAPVVNEPTFRDDIAAVNATDASLLPWYVDPYSDTGAAVYTMALSGDGQTLYVGGAFEWIGGYIPGPGVVRSRLAALNTYNPASPGGGSGQLVKATWSPYANGPVEALAVSGNTVYAGGFFDSVGGVLRSNIAAMNTDTGAAVSGWNPGADGAVYALAMSGATLYAGGAFTHLGNGATTVRNHLAALDGGTGTLASWNPNLDNTGGTGPAVVGALATSGNTVYAGGTFTHVGGPAGTARNNLAAIATSSGQATAWDPSPDGAVKAITMSADGQTLYTGGAFTHAGGSARNYLAALNTTGAGAALSWNPNIGNAVSPTDAVVDTLALYGSTLYVGGLLDSVGGTLLSSSNLTAINATTGSALVWAPATDNAATSLLVSGDGLIVYAGFSPIPNHIGIRYFATLGGFLTAPTAFASAAPPDGTAGTAYSFTFAADGTPAPTFSVTAGGLPPGLLLNASGLLHGTPTVADTYAFTVTASNVAGQLPQTFTLTIRPTAPTAFASAAPPDGVAGTAYSFTFAADGTPAPTFSVTAGGLPPGLLLDASGLLHGTPTAVDVYTFTVTARNMAGQLPQTLTLTIRPAAPTAFTSTAPPAGTAGTAYSFTFAADGTPAPTFSVTAGGLPPGLLLDASGLLHGTPAAAGTYAFTVAARNAGGQYQQRFTIAFRAAAPAIFTNAAPPSGTAGKSYRFTFTTSDNPAPTFSVTGGGLPPGLLLDTSGLLHGTPAAAGTYAFTVTASNASGQLPQAFTIQIGSLVYLPLIVR
ncbi:Ig domain-containing protein [Oscillochloris sp. ZM17-4]|uniref:beta strand repeat-containing protein n=1 Tax=Oscillochloris sp. ZM17-4 TaxID=2866714 RepID=UPI001C732772|nr:Ig domain-containing protein [Oscillochloris sp. ZM17-4]MBX0330470.1 Ig domain-containing protein [Oscillochloris sp. ZM17-4]